MQAMAQNPQAFAAMAQNPQAFTALARNPHWIDQIIEESDTVGNFFKPQ